MIHFLISVYLPTNISAIDDTTIMTSHVEIFSVVINASHGATRREGSDTEYYKIGDIVFFCNKLID